MSAYTSENDTGTGDMKPSLATEPHLNSNLTFIPMLQLKEVSKGAHLSGSWVFQNKAIVVNRFNDIVIRNKFQEKS